MDVQSNTELETGFNEYGQNTILEVAEKMAVETKDDLEIANNIILRCADFSKKVKAYFEPLKKSAHSLWKDICGRENSLLDYPNKARATIQEKILNYKKKVFEEMQKLQNEMNEQMQRQDPENYQAALVISEIKRTEKTELGTVSMTKRLVVEVSSLRDLAQAVVDGKIHENVLEAKPGAILQWARGNGLTSFQGMGLIIKEVEQLAVKPNYQ